jgi:integrase
LVLLGAATGMRSGELRGLTVDRLIWGDHLTVRVDRQLTTTEPTWGPPKTSKSDRAVTVDDTAAGMLQYHMARWPPHETGLIFTGRENGPLARTSIATAWAAATKGMELPDRSGLHALRHYHASLLIAAGVSVTAVADRLGHQDSTETLKTYAHLWPNDEARSRDAVAAGLWG